jgi:hypothetical protein
MGGGAGAGAGGAGGGQQVALSGGQGAGEVTSLPSTGASDVVRNVSLASLATGAAGAAAHFAASIYRRRVFNV